MVSQKNIKIAFTRRRAAGVAFVCQCRFQIDYVCARWHCVQCSFSCDLLGRLDVHGIGRPVKEFLADFLKLFQYLHSCNIWPDGWGRQRRQRRHNKWPRPTTMIYCPSLGIHIYVYVYVYILPYPIEGWEGGCKRTFVCAKCCYISIFYSKPHLYLLLWHKSCRIFTFVSNLSSSHVFMYSHKSRSSGKLLARTYPVAIGTSAVFAIIPREGKQ